MGCLILNVLPQSVGRLFHSDGILQDTVCLGSPGTSPFFVFVLFLCALVFVFLLLLLAVRFILGDTLILQNEFESFPS